MHGETVKSRFPNLCLPYFLHICIPALRIGCSVIVIVNKLYFVLWATLSSISFLC